MVCTAAPNYEYISLVHFFAQQDRRNAFTHLLTFTLTSPHTQHSRIMIKFGGNVWQSPYAKNPMPNDANQLKQLKLLYLLVFGGFLLGSFIANSMILCCALVLNRAKMLRLN